MDETCLRPAHRPSSSLHHRGNDMLRSDHNFRALRRAVGTIGVGALITLSSAPCAVAEGSGAGLLLGTIAPIGGMQPGSTFEAPVAFENQGTQALEKVWLRYTVTQGLDYADVPSN